MIRLNGTGTGDGTGNGTDTIRSNEFWSLFLSRTGVNWYEPIDAISGPCTSPSPVPLQCQYTISGVHHSPYTKLSDRVEADKSWRCWVYRVGLTSEHKPNSKISWDLLQKDQICLFETLLFPMYIFDYQISQSHHLPFPLQYNGQLLCEQLC